uniref:Uncharacterized protein n=1 Tax=Arundo donax TaxID=35708 RepID=A0A0A9AZD1_ARUDO
MPCNCITSSNNSGAMLLVCGGARRVALHSVGGGRGRDEVGAATGRGGHVGWGRRSAAASLSSVLGEAGRLLGCCCR